MRTNRRWLLFLLLVGASLALPHIAHAAAAGGGTMPWDSPLTNIKNDLTGPTAFILSLVGIFCCLVPMLWGSEINHVVRGVIVCIFIVSVLTGIASAATMFGIAGAVVA